MSSNQLHSTGNNGTERNSNVGDDFGYGRSSIDPSMGSLQTAPTERYATHYKMNHPKRGLAVIFNHEFFTVSELRRIGANVDCENLVSALKDLGFEVKEFQDLTYEDIAKNLERIAEMDHSNHDCLVIAVLSHGELDLLYAHDGAYEVDMIWSYFTSDKCPTLAGKPKLFFIQACRGDKLDGGTSLEVRTETTETNGGQSVFVRTLSESSLLLERNSVVVETTTTFRIPTQADFLIAYATVPGYYSWRNEERGSWFMQALCLELRNNGTRYDILTLLTFVAMRVAVDFESDTPDNLRMHQQKQVPCTYSRLTRLVKFTPISNGAIIGDAQGAVEK